MKLIQINISGKLGGIEFYVDLDVRNNLLMMLGGEACLRAWGRAYTRTRDQDKGEKVN